jgi:putative ABC transport system substrate-binding protein
MRRRFLTSAVMTCLCLMTYGCVWAAGGVPIWVALSESGGPHVEAAAALVAEVDQAQPGRVDWRIAHWSQFGRSNPEPAWIIAVGTAALKGMQDLYVRDAPPPPLLAILVPRLAFERMADPVRLRAGSLSAVFLDQPAARQLDLIRLALPDARSVGILVSGQSKAHAPVLDAAARERGLQLVSSVVEPGGLYPALQSLLPDVDVLLALPDPMMFNSQTAGSILTAAYRRQVPLAGFSPRLCQSGCLAGPVFDSGAGRQTRGGAAAPGTGGQAAAAAAAPFAP